MNTQMDQSIEEDWPLKANEESDTKHGVDHEKPPRQTSFPVFICSQLNIILIVLKLAWQMLTLISQNWFSVSHLGKFGLFELDSGELYECLMKNWEEHCDVYSRAYDAGKILIASYICSIVLQILLFEKFMQFQRQIFHTALPVVYVCVLFLVEAGGIVTWFLVTKVDTLACDEATPWAGYAPFLSVIGVGLTFVIIITILATVCNVTRSTLNPLRDHVCFSQRFYFVLTMLLVILSWILMFYSISSYEWVSHPSEPVLSGGLWAFAISDMEVYNWVSDSVCKDLAYTDICNVTEALSHAGYAFLASQFLVAVCIALLTEVLLIGILRGVYYGSTAGNMACAALALFVHVIGLTAWLIISDIDISRECLFDSDELDEIRLWAAEGPALALVQAVVLLIIMVMFVCAHWSRDYATLESKIDPKNFTEDY